MSGRVVGWAMKQRTGSPAAKLVLAKLADNSNEEGLCWPSIDLLVEHTELGQSTVYKHLAALEEVGLITSVPNFMRNGVNLKAYQLTIPQEEEQIPPGGKVEKPKKAIPPKGNEIPPGGNDVLPAGTPYIEEPSSEPSVEPSHTRASIASRWDEIWRAFQTWPVDQSGWSERRTRLVAERCELPSPDVLIACITAASREYTLANKHRSSKDPVRPRHPNNWLEADRGWEKHLAEVEAAPKRIAAGVEKANAVRDDIGPEIVTRLARAGVTEAMLSDLVGATFDPGPPPALSVPSAFVASRLAAIEMRLSEEFGVGFKIVVARRAA